MRNAHRRQKRQERAARTIRRIRDKHYPGPRHCVACNAELRVNSWFCDFNCIELFASVPAQPIRNDSFVRLG